MVENVMCINGRPITHFGAELERDYYIGSTPIDNTIQHGGNRTTFQLESQEKDLKQIVLSIFFYGEDHKDVTMRKSAFDAACHGKLELYLPNGFFYDCVLKNPDQLEYIGETCGRSTYIFSGIQRDGLITVQGNELFAFGTMPQMDCRLTVVASADSAEYHLAGAIFTDIEAGDVIVFDGLNSIIKINGGNAADRCIFYRFPQLAAGHNTIDCIDTVTVEYYPIYA